MARLMRADKRYFDKAMGSLAVLLSLVPTVVLSVMWNSIPQLIPAHWSADSIDRWGQKWELLIVPTICLISGLMLAVYAFKRDSDDMNGATHTDGANSHFIVRNRRLAIAFLTIALFSFSALSLVHTYLSLQAGEPITLQSYGMTLFYIIDGLVFILLGVVFPIGSVNASSRLRRLNSVYAKGLLILAGATILLFCGTGFLRGHAALLLMSVMIIVPAVLISVSSYRNRQERFL